MTFTIGMANHNREQYIEEAIDSVLNQTFQDFELIIIDDCSSDKSEEIVKSYMKNSNKVKLFKTGKPQSGQPIAHKIGIENAQGTYYAIVDSDDFIVPTTLEEMNRFINANQQCGFWYSNYSKCDANLNRIESGPSHYPIQGGSILYDKNAVSHLKIFRIVDYYKSVGLDDRYVKAFDRDLTLRMEEVCEFAYYPKELYLWRGNRNGVSRGKNYPEAKRLFDMSINDAKKRRGIL